VRCPPRKSFERFSEEIVMTAYGARIECYTSRRKLLGLILLTAVMVAVSYFCTTQRLIEGRVFGWIGVVFFGLGFVVFPIMAFRQGPQVIIDEEGILDRRMKKIGVIPWKDIRSLSLGEVNSAAFLCVNLVDREKYVSRFPRWYGPLFAMNQAMGFPGLTISFAGLRPGLKEVWEYLQVTRRAGNLAEPVRPRPVE
jgi:hypothetical protein